MPVFTSSPEQLYVIKSLFPKSEYSVEEFSKIIEQANLMPDENTMPPISPMLVVTKFGPILETCSNLSSIGFDMEDRFKAGDETCLDSFYKLKTVTMELIEQIQAFERSVCSLTNPDLKKTKFKFRCPISKDSDIMP